MTAQERILFSRAGLDARGSRGGLALTLRDGVIAEIAHDDRADAPDTIVMPALVNAHDHTRALRNSSVGGFGKPLESWLHRLPLAAPVDAYLAALAPLGRAALGGQGAVMVHCVRPQGLTDLPTEAAAVARAARDVGVRIAFGIGMRDQNPLVYGSSEPVLANLDPDVAAEIERRFLAPMQPFADQMAQVDAIEAAAKGPMVDIQYAPNGPQWLSEPSWRKVAEASALSGRRITTHLFETKYQRAWADREYPAGKYPGGMIGHWRDIGLLSPRLTLAHCVWARPDELELIAEAGCTIVVNSSSNFHLRSGIAPVEAMLKAGCKVAMGVDGQAFDEDDDALRELRLLWALHGGWGFEGEGGPQRALAIALENGREALGAPEGGMLANGAAADLVVVDRAALDEDAITPVDPLDLLFARANHRHLLELIVAGRTVVSNGRLLGVDLDSAHSELRAHYRKGLSERSLLREALPALDHAVRSYYGERLGCC